MSEDLRGIINSGHTRTTAFVVRVEGEDLKPRKFSTWTPISFASIGKLPGTIEDRSITIPLHRRRSDENVERLRRNHLPPFAELSSRAARWAVDHMNAIASADPNIPYQLHDRAADNWRPLLGIADATGIDWPERARLAAIKLSADGASDQDSFRTLMLGDVRDAYRNKKTDRMSSDEIAVIPDKPRRPPLVGAEPRQADDQEYPRALRKAVRH
jgi:putative DNA primase/helicase